MRLDLIRNTKLLRQIVRVRRLHKHFEKCM